MTSSRRNAGDVHILAMLDGLGTRPQSKRLAWYGLGGMLACGLLGTLAWLARAPASGTPPKTIAIALPAPPLPPSDAALAADPEPAPVPTPMPTRRAAGATIVNAPELAQQSIDPAAVASTAASTAGSTAASTAAAASPQPHAQPLREAAAPAHASLPSSRNTAMHVQAAHPVLANSHTLARHGVPKHATNPSAPAPAAVDTDVALITAIMQHAANLRDATQDSGCNDKSCGPRLPPQP